MIPSPRASRATLLALLLASASAPFFSSLALAGPAALPTGIVGGPVDPATVTVDTAPWLYKGSDIEQDKEWRFGRLPNGLRYAVRKNGVPPGQVAVRVRIDAGSLNETDSERGFAHFIEHLSFRGSEYVPDGEAKRTWQRFGATFGTDQNAQTTPTQTVFHLDLPGATEGSLDESLKILSGMMEKPNIVPAALDAERPVVLAEQREQPGPQVRVGDAVRATLFAGQPLADRSPIGNIKTLEAATAPAVLAFHDRWYRPENAVVIVVGDMDPDVLARLVTKNFASWRGVGPVPPAPDFGRPRAGQPATATTVEPSMPEVVTEAVLRPWHFNNDTVIFNQKRLVDTIATQVIDRRLETRARAGGSFLQASVSLDDVSRSANLTSVTVVPLGGDWERALKDVRGVIADAMKRPPTQAEIDQELAGYDSGMKTLAATAPVQMGTRLADDMVQALDIRETTTSPQASYDVFLGARKKGMFTPAAILASTRRIFRGDATRALVNLHAPDPAAAPRLAAALKADVAGDAGARTTQGAVSFAALPPLGPPGTVTGTTPLPGLEMETVTYGNGVRALLFPNTGETGRIYVRVRWGGGQNQLPADHTSPAWAGELALVAGGIGTLKQGDLDALTAGRQIGLDFDIGDDAFTLGATTTPADLADQLKLMADKIAAPGWDPAPVLRAKGVILTSYAGFDASPDGVLSRDLDGLLHDGDPRWTTPAPATVQATTPDDFRKLWEPILKSGPIEVSVFGDVTADVAIKAIAATFGALPPRDAALPPPPPIRFPAHVAMPVVRTHNGNENQAAAVIAWPTGGGVAGIAESRRLDVLAQIFSDRLFERLRQAAGASYSPNVSSQWPVGLSGGGRLVAIGQVAPDKVDFFFRTARAIAAELVAKPVDADEFRRIMGSMAQSLTRASTANQFWMRQMAGAAFDPARATATANIFKDFTTITPQQLQEVAAKYLRPDRDWTMEVLPKDVAAKIGPATAGAATMGAASMGAGATKGG
ncbi:MAG: M16 family metallopeptidase [Janthinobacterium lividum]